MLSAASSTFARMARIMMRARCSAVENWLERHRRSWRAGAAQLAASWDTDSATVVVACAVGALPDWRPVPPPSCSGVLPAGDPPLTCSACMCLRDGTPARWVEENGGGLGDGGKIHGCARPSLIGCAALRGQGTPRRFRGRADQVESGVGSCVASDVPVADRFASVTPLGAFSPFFLAPPLGGNSSRGSRRTKHKGGCAPVSGHHALRHSAGAGDVGGTPCHGGASARVRAN